MNTVFHTYFKIDLSHTFRFSIRWRHRKCRRVCINRTGLRRADIIYLPRSIFRVVLTYCTSPAIYDGGGSCGLHVFHRRREPSKVAVSLWIEAFAFLPPALTQNTSNLLRKPIPFPGLGILRQGFSFYGCYLFAIFRHREFKGAYAFKDRAQVRLRKSRSVDSTDEGVNQGKGEGVKGSHFCAAKIERFCDDVNRFHKYRLIHEVSDVELVTCGGRCISQHTQQWQSSKKPRGWCIAISGDGFTRHRRSASYGCLVRACSTFGATITYGALRALPGSTTAGCTFSTETNDAYCAESMPHSWGLFFNGVTVCVRFPFCCEYVQHRLTVYGYRCTLDDALLLAHYTSAKKQCEIHVL